MTLLLKDPLAALDYSVDWGSDYLDGEGISASDWSVEPGEEGGIVVDDHAFDDRYARVTVSGGLAGRTYRLVNRVETTAARTDARSIVLRVEAR